MGAAEGGEVAPSSLRTSRATMRSAEGGELAPSSQIEKERDFGPSRLSFPSQLAVTVTGLAAWVKNIINNLKIFQWSILLEYGMIIRMLL